MGKTASDVKRAGSTGTAGSLDETSWRFSSAPGIEYVEVIDDCFVAAAGG